MIKAKHSYDKIIVVYINVYSDHFLDMAEYRFEMRDINKNYKMVLL